MSFILFINDYAYSSCHMDKKKFLYDIIIPDLTINERFNSIKIHMYIIIERG